MDTFSTCPPISVWPETDANFRTAGGGGDVGKQFTETLVPHLDCSSSPSSLLSLSLPFSRLFLSVSLGDWTLSFIAASRFRDLRTPRSSLLALTVPGYSFLTPLFLCSATCFPLLPLLPACPPHLSLIPWLSWSSPSRSCENKQRPRSRECQWKVQRQGLKLLFSLPSVRRLEPICCHRCAVWLGSTHLPALNLSFPPENELLRWPLWTLRWETCALQGPQFSQAPGQSGWQGPPLGSMVTPPSRYLYCRGISRRQACPLTFS